MSEPNVTPSSIRQPSGDGLFLHTEFCTAEAPRTQRCNQIIKDCAFLPVCYEAAGGLALTGDGQVSEWFSNPTNAIKRQGERLRFEKRSSGRRRDCAVLPTLQFNV